MIDSIAFQINRHSNGRGLWLAGKSDRGDNQGNARYRLYAKTRIPVHTRSIPSDSARFHPNRILYSTKRRWPAMPLGEFQIQIKRPMRKLYESRSKADRTMIEGNLSEKLTFVQCYHSNNFRGTISFPSISLTLLFLRL